MSEDLRSDITSTNAQHSFEELNQERKVVRDLVHGYITLTEIDLRIVDTPHFQRLRNIRQLTSQYVFPAARHTRFEHSLGVMELTRQAMKYLNQNGFIYKRKGRKEFQITQKYEFNTALAALLHDVGHFPFSHLGETQLDDPMDLAEKLAELAEKNEVIHDKEYWKNQYFEAGAPHEIMSCVIILEQYYDILTKTNDHPVVDFDFVIRCILGIPYPVDAPFDANTSNEEESPRIKNILIGLINSSTLDMDKLDYIMRDSLYTGIGVPTIDTKRLFRNMFISSEYEIIFSSKAISALQNVIETRDNLYLWVYNHHTAVYSDFLYTYILRRLRKDCSDQANLRLFSKAAISDDLVSDSSFQSLLLFHYQQLKSKENESYLSDAEQRILNLLEQLFSRKFLKSWWKTIFEFEIFLKINFRDDSTREKLLNRVCAKDAPKTEDKNTLYGDNFRSVIAKCMIGLSFYMKKKKKIQESIKTGDFFLVMRSNKFYSLNSLGSIMVYLKENEITQISGQEYREGDFYGKRLTNLMPQKDYSSIYQKEGFYLYMKQYRPQNPDEDFANYQNEKRAFYGTVLKLFQRVGTTLSTMPEYEFLNLKNALSGKSSEKEIYEVVKNYIKIDNQPDD